MPMPKRKQFLEGKALECSIQAMKVCQNSEGVLDKEKFYYNARLGRYNSACKECTLWYHRKRDRLIRIGQLSRKIGAIERAQEDDF